MPDVKVPSAWQEKLFGSLLLVGLSHLVPMEECFPSCVKHHQLISHNVLNRQLHACNHANTSCIALSVVMTVHSEAKQECVS